VGEFPCSFKIGKMASGWLEAEVSAWIDERAMARQSADRSEYPLAA
jgi:predicted DNA-binding transcriptional regulator AlpA